MIRALLFSFNWFLIQGLSSIRIMLCVDKNKSKDGQEHIVSMMYDIGDNKENLDILFKRLNIVLHEKFDERHPDLNYNEEVRFSDFHEAEKE